MGVEDAMGLVSTATGGVTRRSSFSKSVEKRVSASVLHKDTRQTLDLLRDSDAVAVTHYNEVEGYLLSPDRYTGLLERAKQAEEREAQVASVLPLLLAAARTQTPIPSESLEGILPAFNLADHWRDVARFAATFPIRFDAGEHGEPITRPSFSRVHGYSQDTGTDDELNLD